MEKIIEYIAIAKKVVLKNESIVRKILATIIILVTIVVIASCLNSNKNDESLGNSFNSGLATEDGKWIYYVEIDDDEPVGINRIKENGKKIENVTDGYFYYINIVDNYIYCLEYDEDKEQNNLIKIKNNGKNKEILVKDIDEQAVVATDKYVFYSKNDNLYRAKLNGTERVKLSDKDISYYQVEGKRIYYIYEKENYQYIARMKLNGEENERIARIDSEEEAYQTLYVENNTIYYVMSKINDNYDTNYYLYKMNKKGEKIEKICKLDTNIDRINMQSDKIYYTVTKDYETDSIYSIEYNGTNKEKIKDLNPIRSLNITNKWIFVTTVDEEYDMAIEMISIDGEETIEL